MQKTLKNKILFANVILIIIILIVFGTAVCKYSETIVKKKTMEQLGTTVDIINGHYDTFFSNLNVLSGELIFNNMIQEYLKEEHSVGEKREYQDFLEQSQVSEVFQDITKRQKGIYSIAILGFQGQVYSYSPSGSWNMEYDYTQEEWYQKTLETYGNWIMSGIRQEKQYMPLVGDEAEKVVTFSRLVKDVDNYENIGVLQIDIELEYLQSIGMEGMELGDIAIINADGECILGERVQDEKYLEVEKTSEVSNWSVIYRVEKADLFKEIREMRMITIWFAAAAILVAVCLSQWIIRSLVKPLEKLKERMRLASEGDFDSVIEYTKQDEMGELIDRCNFMTGKLKGLVEEIKEKDKKQMEVELNALQARITPHFMYNTLNSIRWIAMMSGEQKITDLLTSFVYLLKFASKNKGNLIELREEVSILQAYGDLMKARYENFTLEVCLEKDAENSLTVPFVLQPLVENAIIHGISPTKHQGVIRVEIKKTENLIHVMIADDGVGIEQKVLESLLNSEEEEKETFSSIGFKNVIQRLQMNFGDKTEVKVESKLGEGTLIRLAWPAVV